MNTKKTVYARDYGIFPGNADQCARVARMLSEHRADTLFVFEPGQYHFYEEEAARRSFAVSNSNPAQFLKIAILLERMTNILLDGRGADFLFHGDLTPIAISECRRVQLQNLTIDFAVPASAEARVLRAEPGEICIFLDHSRFPFHVSEGTVIFEREYQQESPMFGAIEFDGDTGKVRSHAGDTFPPVHARRTGKYMLSLRGDFDPLPRQGNILVLRHTKRVHPGMLVQYSGEISLCNITVYQTCGLGILFQFCEDMVVSGVRFAPNRKRGMQVLSGHDDGLHFSNDRGRILVENCTFRGLMDDAVNVHGTAACLVERLAPNRLRCAFCHPQSVGFQKWASAGDSVAFLRPADRAGLGEGIVSEYCLRSPTEFEISFEKPVPQEICPGFALENITNTPAFVCRNTYFGSGRARGILVTTPKPVLIENNMFETSGSAIAITGDVKEWYESGTCRDVTIRGNQFNRCCTSRYQFCSAVIHIEPGVEEGVEAVVHRNIRITNNQFALADGKALYADHTGAIQMEGNMISMDG